MRPVLLLAALLAAVPASAQDGLPDPTSARPTPGQRTALVVVGALGEAGAAIGTYALGGRGRDTPAGVLLVVAAYPLGTTLATQVVGLGLGVGAPLSDALLDATPGVPVGALAGLGAGLVVGGLYYGVQLATNSAGDYNFIPVLVGGGIGVLVGTTVAASFATRRYRVEPVVLATPEGERGPGLRLRVGL